MNNKIAALLLLGAGIVVGGIVLLSNKADATSTSSTSTTTTPSPISSTVTSSTTSTVSPPVTNIPSFMSYPQSAATNVSGINTHISIDVMVYGGSSTVEAYIQATQNREQANTSLIQSPLNTATFYASLSADMSNAVVIATGSFPNGEFGNLTASAVVPISRFKSYLGVSDTTFTCYMVAVNTSPNVRSSVISVNVSPNNISSD